MALGGSTTNERSKRSELKAFQEKKLGYLRLAASGGQLSVRMINDYGLKSDWN